MRIYRVSFHNNGKMYQLHAQQLGQAEIYGFIEISGLMFSEHTSVVIDPAEEKLQLEFAGVERLILPIHSVVRIEDVEKKGKNKILEFDGTVSNVSPFPLPPNNGNPG